MHCRLNFPASVISRPSSSTSSTFLFLPPSLYSPLLSSSTSPSSSLLPLLSSSSTSPSSFYLSSLLLTALNLTSPLLPSSHLLLFSPPGSVLASSAVRQGRYRHCYDRLREDLGLLDSSPIENIQSGYVTVCVLCVV